MKAGHELDVLIAEKVFGCKVIRATEPGISQEEFENRRLTGDRCGCHGGHHIDLDDGCGSCIKEYSTDIAAAWKVVEKMHSHPKPVLMLAAPQQDYVNEKWRAEFCRKFWTTDLPYEWAVSAETAPLAICLAAIAANVK